MIARSLASYYADSGRRYPWRSTEDPFILAVAEILLQKTRADAAVATFIEVVAEYKTPCELAAGNRATLKKLLRPLGLFRKRSASLVELAKALVDRGLSVLSDPNEAITLPGIGEYGARAIACFAFGRRVGIVDANVRRVLTRVFGLPKLEPRSKHFQRMADALAKQSTSVKATNFGILDLAAQVCKTRPRCGICPLASNCEYFARKSYSKTAVR